MEVGQVNQRRVKVSACAECGKPCPDHLDRCFICWKRSEFEVQLLAILNSNGEYGIKNNWIRAKDIDTLKEL